MNRDHIWIMGRHPIEELLRHAPNRIKQVWALDQEKNQKRKSSILEKIEEEGIALIYKRKKEIEAKVGSDSHQGFIALIEMQPSPSIEDLLEKKTVTLLFLDSVQDPQNIGTIIRSCDAFGADAVIWSKNRGPKITPSLVKASSGAALFVPIITISNLVDTLRRIQKEGVHLIACAIDQESSHLEEMEKKEKLAIILGSEGRGIQQLILRQVDQKIYISMKGRVDSLNVAQAATLILYQRSLYAK